MAGEFLGRIGVDIDDVVYRFSEGFAAYNNQKYDTNLTAADFGRYDFESVLGISRFDVYRRLIEFGHRNYGFRPPIEGAERVLQKLVQAGYELVAITGRNDYFDRATSVWLNRYFPGLFKGGVNYTCVVEGDEGPRAETKAEICRRLGVTVLIDDLLENVLPTAEAGIPAILFGDYERTRVGDVHPLITRCLDWARVEAYFDGIS